MSITISYERDAKIYPVVKVYLSLVVEITATML